MTTTAIMEQNSTTITQRLINRRWDRHKRKSLAGLCNISQGTARNYVEGRSELRFDLFVRTLVVDAKMEQIFLSVLAELREEYDAVGSVKVDRQDCNVSIEIINTLDAVDTEIAPQDDNTRIASRPRRAGARDARVIV